MAAITGTAYLSFIESAMTVAWSPELMAPMLNEAKRMYEVMLFTGLLGIPAAASVSLDVGTARAGDEHKPVGIVGTAGFFFFWVVLLFVVTSQMHAPWLQEHKYNKFIEPLCIAIAERQKREPEYVSTATLARAKKPDCGTND